MLQSKDILLRRLGVADSEMVRNWRRSVGAYGCFFEYLPVTPEQNRAWIEKSLERSDEINFIIEQGVDNAHSPIGMIALTKIDFRSRKCDLGRLFVAKGSRGEKIGRQAVKLLLEYAFLHLGLHKVCSEMFADNEIAINCCKACGFEKEGIRRAHVFKDGEYRDVVMMARFAD